MIDDISLLATAVGSLPFDNPEEALDLVFKDFPEFPFMPTLSRVNPKEDMIAQFTQKIPGAVFDKDDNRWYLDPESEGFYEQLEEFYLDYESIVNEGNLELLDKYGITGEYSSTLPVFLERLKDANPVAIKGQVIGPFTWGTSLIDREKRCAYYDDTLKEIIIKGLTLKALWLVQKFKEACPTSLPVIFLDEPSMSQYGTSAFITVTKEDIIDSINEIAKVLKDRGAMVGIHCCGKTDWSIITGSEVNILNFDGFYFAESLSLYSKEIAAFLQRGCYIAWGIVPTLDEDALKASTPESLTEKYEQAKSYLVNKGIDEGLVIKAGFITPTCGAGSLPEDLAIKAMKMTAELSRNLRQKYYGGR